MSIIMHDRNRGNVGRPVKWRRVAFTPEVTFFKPAGIPARMLEEICLSVEEAEAIRLKDLESLDQEQCAEKMNISRPTFHRVLASARHKLANALLNGKAIRIEGGNFEMAKRRFKCLEGHEWDIPFETIAAEYPMSCPKCNSSNIAPLQPASYGCDRKGQGRRQFRGRHGR